MTRPALSALLNERAQLSAEIALQIEKVLGISIKPLKRMQNIYDIYQARKRTEEIKPLLFEKKILDPQPAIM